MPDRGTAYHIPLGDLREAIAAGDNSDMANAARHLIARIVIDPARPESLTV